MASLGCSKNLVDSEHILGELHRKGYTIAPDIHGVDIAIINTCAFIKDATEESIEAILEAVELKQAGDIKVLIVAGCLPQRYWSENLSDEIQEVDAFVGVGQYHLIADVVEKALKGLSAHAVGIHPGGHRDSGLGRFVLTPDHYAYIKISEGCDNHCSYCVIPHLRGPYRSRRIKSVVDEVQQLSRERFLSEINLIGQDTTYYGTDLYGTPRLGLLLRRLARLTTVGWIRLLYTHPAHFSADVMDVIREEPSLCRYIDLPLQHISNPILQKMGRKVTQAQIVKLIGQLRDAIPDVTLRTTFIVGFPGETGREFNDLLRFVEETRFERLGAFTYSREEGTPAFKLPGQVPERVKKERLHRLMKTQRDISLKRNTSLIGTNCQVLIDNICEEEDELYMARTEGDAPDVDQLVYVRGRDLRAGQFIQVTITDAYEYDLVAEPV